MGVLNKMLLWLPNVQKLTNSLCSKKWEEPLTVMDLWSMRIRSLFNPLQAKWICSRIRRLMQICRCFQMQISYWLTKISVNKLDGNQARWACLLHLFTKRDMNSAGIWMINIPFTDHTKSGLQCLLISQLAQRIR